MIKSVLFLVFVSMGVMGGVNEQNAIRVAEYPSEAHCREAALQATYFYQDTRWKKIAAAPSIGAVCVPVP